MRRRSFLAASAAAALTLAAATLAHAATYYVATTGDDTNNAGTSLASPWRTIQHAVDQAKPGDAIEVRGGVYQEAVHFQQSGASGAPIVLRNHAGEAPVIEAAGGFPILLEAEPWQNRLEIGWITVDGFELRGGTVGVEITNVHDAVVSRCYVHDNTVQGILGAGHDIVIERNVIEHNGDATGGNNLDHGMYLTGRRFQILDNLVRGNAAYGLQAAAYGCYASSGECAGLDYSGVVDWLVANNTFALQQNRAAVVLWLPDASYGTPLGTIGSITLQNNIAYENDLTNAGTTNGVDLVGWSGDSTVVIDHNLFFSNNGGADVAPGSATVTASIDADPRFVDAGAFDFHLGAGSPAIDVGVTIPQVTVDLDGVHRPQGAAYDVGAYERCAGPCTDGSDAGAASDGGDASAAAGDAGAGHDAAADATAEAGGGGPGPMPGADAGSDAASNAATGSSGGCACRAAPARHPGGCALAAILGAVALVRRRRRQPTSRAS
jgi:serralysin